jgi:hypothetical protein
MTYEKIRLKLSLCALYFTDNRMSVDKISGTQFYLKAEDAEETK